MLIEAALAMSLIVVATYFVFESTATATKTTGFAIHAQLLDNYLANQAAAVRVASIQAGGTLTLPSFSTLTFSSTATTQNGVPLNAGSQHTAQVTTLRKSAVSINGQETWEYVIQGSIPRRLFGASPNTPSTYTKALSVMRAVPL